MRNVNSMEMEIILRQVQSNRLSVTKKVNFMSAAREL
jgi:hypothetical protein